MESITIAETDEQIRRTFHLMGQLHPNVLELGSLYLEHIRALQAEGGYKLANLTKNEHPICVAGFRICRNLGWGKYLYVDDLVTDQQFRSQGVGQAMVQWLLNYAREQRCLDLRLDTKLERHRAHHFYISEGMDIFAFHFRFRLGQRL